MKGNAGDALIFDSTVWHRAGKNTSNELRPMIVIKYTLAPFKQQFDFWNIGESYYPTFKPVLEKYGFI